MNLVNGYGEKHHRYTYEAFQMIYIHEIWKHCPVMPKRR